jgi:hypothetical protein
LICQDRQRLGDALQQRAAEFLPLNRPLRAGLEKFHQSWPGEQLQDQGHEIVSQSPNRQRINAGLESVEHDVEIFAGARDDRVCKAFLVRKEAVKRADLRARTGGDFSHCRAFVPLFANDSRRGLQYGGHPQFAIGPLRRLNSPQFFRA